MRENKLRFIFFVSALFLIWFFGRFFHIEAASLQGFLKKFPLFYSATLFVLLYCAVTFFVWLSKDIFRLIAAIFFGAGFSTVLVFIAETINAFILFNLSRNLGRGFLEKTLKGKLNNLDKGLGKLNFFWLFMFRSVPLIPFRFLDLACGLTEIPFKKYLLAVIMGSPLRIFWVQYILAGVGTLALGNPSALMEFLSLNKPLFILSFTYIILVILVAFKIKFKD